MVNISTVNSCILHWYTTWCKELAGGLLFCHNARKCSAHPLLDADSRCSAHPLLDADSRCATVFLVSCLFMSYTQKTTSKCQLQCRYSLLWTRERTNLRWMRLRITRLPHMWDMSDLFTLVWSLWFWHLIGAKFHVAMVVHVICSCAFVTCAHRPPNRY